MENIYQHIQDNMPLILQWSMDVIGAIVILIIGWAAARWFSGRVKKSATKSETIDATLTPILTKTTYFFVLIVTVLAVLGQFGVQTTSIVAILGAAGLAVGFALQGTLSNVASGVLLLTLRPFSIGDVVDIGGTLGIVDEVGLFVTELDTFENVGITMPNTLIWASEIKNYTKNEIRRVDMVFGIGYDDDMDQAMQILREELDKDDRVLDDPEPLLVIGELADSSVNINVRPWTQTDNVWPLRYDFTKRTKERFDEAGINIPYPQRDVHLYKTGE